MATEAASLLINVRALGIGKVKGELLALQGGLVAAEGSAAGAGAAVEGAGKSASKSSGLFGRSTRQLIGYAAGFASIAAASKLARESIKTTEDLAKSTASLSSLTGISTKQGSAWIEVAKQRGVESTKLSRGFVSISKAMEDANAGGKKNVELFKSLGISHKELISNDPTRVLLDVSDAFHKMGPGADRAVAAQKLLGKAGISLVGFLSQGSAAIREQLGLADKYGATLDNKTLKGLLKAAQAQREFNLAMDGLKITLGTQLIPLMDKGVVAFNKFVLQARSGTGAGGEFVTTMKQLGAAIIPRIQEFAQMTASITKFVASHKALSQLATAIGAVAVAAKAVSFVLPVAAIKDAIKLYKDLRTAAAGAAVAEAAAGGGGRGKVPTPKGGVPKVPAVVPLGLGATATVVGGMALAMTGAIVAGGKLADTLANKLLPGADHSRSALNILTNGLAGTEKILNQVSSAAGQTGAGIRKAFGSVPAQVQGAANALQLAGVRGVKAFSNALALIPGTKRFQLLMETGPTLQKIARLSTVVKKVAGEKAVVQILTNAPSASTAIQAFRAILKGVPPSKVVKILHNAKSSKDAADQLSEAIHHIPPSHKTHLTLSGYETALANIANLRTQLDALRQSGATIPTLSPKPPRRRGGTVSRYADGGLVQAMMSPGEALRYPGGGWGMVPGTPTAADNVAMSVPSGTEVFTGSGQAMLASGASRSQALSMQAPHFRKGGEVPSYAKGGWVKTGFTIDPGGSAKQQYNGGMSFAELLQAGANRGLHPNLTEILGLKNTTGYGMDYPQFGKPAQPILVRAGPGHTAYKIVKSDVGSGSTYDKNKYTIDLHGAIANKLHLGGKGFLQVARVGTASTAGGKGVDPDGPTRRILAGTTSKISGAYRPNLGDESTAPGGYFDFRGNPTGLLSETLGNVTMPAFKTIGTKKAPTISPSAGGGGGGAHNVPGGLVWGSGSLMQISKRWPGSPSRKNPRLSSFTKFMQGAGFAPSESPWLPGGVHPVHAHYGDPDHYHGGATDIPGSGSTGRRIANLAAAAARVGFLRLWGPGIIWQGPGAINPGAAAAGTHTTHVHVSAHRRGGLIKRFRAGGVVGRAAAKKPPKGKADPVRKTRDIKFPPAIFRTIDAIGTAGSTKITRVKGLLTTLAHQVQDGHLSFGQLKSASAHVRVDIGKLRRDRKLTPREKVQLPRLEKALGLVEGEIRNRVTDPGTGAQTLTEGITDESGFLDYLTAQGIDPESAQGIELRRGREGNVISTLESLRPGLQQAYDRALRSGNPALTASAGAALTDLNRSILHEKANLTQLKPPADTAAEDLARQQLEATQALAALIAEQVAGQKRLEGLINTQGPQLLAGVVAAVNGGIGGKIGLGTQTPAFAGAGGLSRY